MEEETKVEDAPEPEEQAPEEPPPQTPEPSPEAAPPEVTPEAKPKRKRAPPKNAQARPLAPESVGLVVDHNFWTNLMRTHRDMDRTRRIDRYSNFSIV